MEEEDVTVVARGGVSRVAGKVALVSDFLWVEAVKTAFKKNKIKYRYISIYNN